MCKMCWCVCIVYVCVLMMRWWWWWCWVLELGCDHFVATLHFGMRSVFGIRCAWIIPYGVPRAGGFTTLGQDVKSGLGWVKSEPECTGRLRDYLLTEYTETKRLHALRGKIEEQRQRLTLHVYIRVEPENMSWLRLTLGTAHALVHGKHTSKRQLRSEEHEVMSNKQYLY